MSIMELLQDDLCFILDLEGFFLNKTFHVRELAYYTWNEEHGRHAFFIPVPYKTSSAKELHNKDVKTKDVLLYVRGFKYLKMVRTGCKRNGYPLCMFEIRSFTHSTQPTPIKVTRYCVCSKMNFINLLSIFFTI